MQEDISFVTVCICYSRTYQITSPDLGLKFNRLVITVSDDKGTKRAVLSSRNSKLSVYAGKLYGGGFHAAYNKARYLNAGLKELRRRGARGWVILLDADILLPPDFGERMEGLLPLLDKKKLYGLRGRRVAATQEEFEGMRKLGPWEAGLETFETVVGYFNLFHLNGPHRKYPPSDPEQREHDDYRFYSLFGKANTATLPITALHLGKTYVNWSGQTEIFAEARGGVRTAAHEDSVEPVGGDGILLGAWAPDTAKDLAARCRRLFVVDSRRLSRMSHDELEEADREFLWNRFTKGLSGLENVGLLEEGEAVPQPVKGTTEIAGTPSARRLGLTLVPMPKAKSVKWLQLGVEPSYDFLLEELPRWLRTLKKGGWIAGTHYGQPAFPQTTPTIELLLGTPERRGADGSWALQYRPVRSPLRRSEVERRADAAREKRGVVLWLSSRDEVQRGITALHALRTGWAGAVAVVYDGQEMPALRIACAMHDAAYIAFPSKAEVSATVGERPPPLLSAGSLDRALLMSPFAETLFLTPESGKPAVNRWFSALAKSDGMVASPESVGMPKGFAFRRAMLLPLLARWGRKKRTFYTLESELPALLQRRVKVRLARALSVTRLDAPEHELALVAAQPAHVWLPEDCTVVTAVMREDVEALHRNWQALRWPVGVRRLVVPCFESTEGAEKRTEKETTDAASSVSSRAFRGENSWLPAGAEGCPLSAKAAKALGGEPYWTQALLSAARRTGSKYLLYLDPCMTPLPGAELFPEAGDAAYAGSGWCFMRRGKSVLKTPKLGPPATLIERAWLLEAAVAFPQRRRKTDAFEVFLHARAKAERRQVVVADVMARGWSR